MIFMLWPFEITAMRIEMWRNGITLSPSYRTFFDYIIDGAAFSRCQATTGSEYLGSVVRLGPFERPVFSVVSSGPDTPAKQAFSRVASKYCASGPRRQR